MREGEMRRENRHRVAEDQEIVLIEDSFLRWRELIQTEKTGFHASIFVIHISRTAPQPSRIILKPNGKAIAAQMALLNLLEPFITFLKLWPCFSLLAEEV